MHLELASIKPFVPRISTISALLIVTASLSTSAQINRGDRFQFNDQVIEIYYDHSNAEEAKKLAGGPLTQAQLQAQAQRFIGIIKGVASFSDGLRLPEKLLLRIGPVELNPSANTFRNVLNLGARFGTVDSQGRLFTQHPDEMIPVTAHEYGHLVFGTNVLDRFVFMHEMRKKFAAMYEIEAIVIKLEERSQKLSDLLARRKDPRLEAELESVLKELAHWTDEMMEMSKTLEPVSAILGEHVSPYNEFFADVVAVLYTEEPNAISDSIHFSSPNGKPGKDKVRAIELKNRLFEKRGTDPKLVATGHGVFQQSRVMIWDEYLSRPTVMRTRKNDVLKALVRAMRAEITWKIGNAKIVPIQNVQLVNQRLIQRLRLELRDLQ